MLFKNGVLSGWKVSAGQAAKRTPIKSIGRYTFESMLSFCLSVTVLFIVTWLLGIVKEALLIGLTGAIIKSLPEDYI